MTVRELAFSAVATVILTAALAKCGQPETYQLVTYADGQRYVDDFGLTLSDCRQAEKTAFRADLDGVSCERQ